MRGWDFPSRERRGISNVSSMVIKQWQKPVEDGFLKEGYGNFVMKDPERVSVTHFWGM